MTTNLRDSKVHGPATAGDWGLRAGHCMNWSKTSYQEDPYCVYIYSTSGLQSRSAREEEQDCSICASCLHDCWLCVCWKRLCSLFRSGNQPHGHACARVCAQLCAHQECVLSVAAGYSWGWKITTAGIWLPLTVLELSSLPRRRVKRTAFHLYALFL